MRRCRITASRLGTVMSKPTKCKDCKGKGFTKQKGTCTTCGGAKTLLTKGYKSLRSQLVMELTGTEFQDRNEPWFEHGRDMEPRAIGAANFKWHWKVENDIFLVHHKYDWLSCTPDGMIDNLREGIEIKCHKSVEEYIKARDHGLFPSHRFQIQGAMWLTGFNSWWYVNYYEHQPTRTRKLCRTLVPRDDTLIAEMDNACGRFMKEVYEEAGLE